MTKIRDIGKLSYSQISLYKQCPRLWYEQYVLGHRLEEVSQALSFGIAYHAGVEELMKLWGKNSALSEAQSKFEWEYCFGRMPGPDEDKWMPIGDKLLLNLAHKLREFDFEPVTIEQMIERNNFRGRIDCVANVNGHKTIIDWKTASREYDPSHVDTDEQLTAYNYLMPDIEFLAFCVGVKGTQNVYWYETIRTKQQVDEFEQMVKSTRREMETLEKFPGMYNREACMAWNRKCDMWQGDWCEGLDDF